jgi:hypothetical protein
LGDFELVRDVETWLRSKFSDFRCIGRVSILEYLRTKVMQGEVRVVREEPMNADNGFAVDLGDVTTLGDAPTPLGGAAPFEYFSSAPSDGVMSMAMRSGRDAQCFADYEQNMDACVMAKALFGGDPRTYALCTSKAFSNYQTCLGY